jgi:hypothetical protein
MEDHDAERLASAPKREHERGAEVGQGTATPLLGQVERGGKARVVPRLLLGHGLTRESLPHLEPRPAAQDRRVAQRPGIEDFGAGIDHPEREFAERAGGQEEVPRLPRQGVALQECQFPRGAHEEP